MHDKYKLVFIIGPGRSGTTLLSNLFQNHPNILSLPEATFFWGLNSYFGEKNIKECVDEFISFLWIRMDEYKPLWAIDNEKLKKDILSHEGVVSFSDALLYCCLNSKRIENKGEIKIIVNKHPLLSWQLPLMLKLYPNAKFICLTRDYRDRYLSVKKSFKFSFFSHLSIGYSWLMNDIEIDKVQAKYPQNFLSVKYEDFITDYQFLKRQMQKLKLKKKVIGQKQLIFLIRCMKILIKKL